MNGLKKVFNVFGIILCVIFSIPLICSLIAAPILSGACDFVQTENLKKIVNEIDMEAIAMDSLGASSAEDAEMMDLLFKEGIMDEIIELYVEDVKTGAVSNGVFSVSKNEWLKRPVPKDIPDFKDDEEYLGLLDAWMIKAKKACSSKSRAEVNAFINDLYNLRRISIMTDGEYALGNLVFKEIRNHGLLQELKDLQNVLASKELSLEGLQ
jgi:hypothetical protein